MMWIAFFAILHAMSYLLKKSPKPDVELSPQQQKLNQLIDQIEQQKVELSAWEQAKNEIQVYAQQTLIPSYHQLHLIWFQQLEQLWQHLTQGDFSKAEIAQLDKKLIELSSDLHASQALEHAQLDLVNEVFQFYQQHLAHQRVSRTTRLPSHSADVEVHNNFFTQQVSEQHSSNTSSKNEQADTTWEDFEWNTAQHQQAREQAKLKKQQEKREQAEKLVTQSLKTVYLKIVASIHPDREPDEVKKIEKTAVLQKANQAYEQQDLFSLLKLQIQIELNTSKGESSVYETKKGLSVEQIKFYLLALEAQGQRLDDQIRQIVESLTWTQQAKADKPKKSKNKPSAQLQVADIYKQIDTDAAHMKQQVKAEKERLKYMQRLSGLEMLLEHQAL